MYQLSKEALEFVKNHKDELIDLERALCRIPAPSNHERARAEFCKKFLEDAGAKGVYIDAADNMVFPINCEGSDKLTLFAAHMDTVFPDLEPMEMWEEDGMLHCPGAGDDTGSVAMVLMISKYLIEQNIQPKNGFLMVCNSCEEGGGGQKGIRQICDDYAGRFAQVYMLDGLYNQVVNWPVAYASYRVEVRAQGGHAYLAFGNPSAAVCAASIVNDVYALPLPEGCKSSYNVGLMSAGSTINVIPQNASFTIELRSELESGLESLRVGMMDIIERHRSMGIYEISIEQKNRIPGKGEINQAEQDRIDNKLREILGQYCEGKTIFRSGAGDINIPMSQGVPGVGFCAYKLYNIHSREEYVDLSSFENGLRASLAVVLSCVDE